jgi:hypothetical protein
MSSKLKQRCQIKAWKELQILISLPTRTHTHTRVETKLSHKLRAAWELRERKKRVKSMRVHQTMFQAAARGRRFAF